MNETMKGFSTMTLTDLAYSLLSTERAADLRPTHDAIELADLLINTGSDDQIDFMIDTATDLDDDMIIPELRSIMTDMILNPID